MVNKTIRCAVYTRKSNEDGLEQDFNSLDSQHDFCEKYITARKNIGFVRINTEYDDGGFSGGNTNRPAFQRLMRDIEAGLIDVIIVYKLDRLTRSLLDFANLLAFFEKHNVSFISVTEDFFDTSTHTGRLILNIFMSFAQYEREMAGQRVRDKIATSKARGMWMGGIPPLGYNIVDRKLVINETEAHIIRQMFNQLIEKRSIAAVVDYLNSKNLKTKSYECSTGKKIEGRSFYISSVTKILKNYTYRGKILYKDIIYKGEHDAIISEEIWNLTQSILTQNKTTFRFKPFTRKSEPSLLQGIIKCSCCNCAMSPTYTRKGNVEYRYYICSSFLKRQNLNCSIKRLSIKEVDSIVTNEILKIFKTREFLLKYLQVKTDVNLSETKELLENVELVWDELYKGEQTKIINKLVSEVIIHTERIDIKIHKDRLFYIMDELVKNNTSIAVNYSIEDDFTISVPVKVKTTTQGAKILETSDSIGSGKGVSDVLIKKIAEAHKWRNNCLDYGDFKQKTKNKFGKENIRKLIKLNLLAPDIAEAVLNGKAPVDLTYSRIVNNPIPMLWDEQRELYGFNERI